jgi:hypothetical protein
LQNEILGDLSLEFTSAPGKGEELPLDELGSALSTGYSGALGKHTNGLISRLIGGKIPGGFNLSAIKTYLSKTWGLDPSRSDGVLLLGLTVEPPKRLGYMVGYRRCGVCPVSWYFAVVWCRLWRRRRRCGHRQRGIHQIPGRAARVRQMTSRILDALSRP